MVSPEVFEGDGWVKHSQLVRFWCNICYSNYSWATERQRGTASAVYIREIPYGTNQGDLECADTSSWLKKNIGKKLICIHSPYGMVKGRGSIK